MLRAASLYLAFAASAIAGPGIAIQRLARLPVDPALVLPLGLATAAGSYWLSLAAGLPWLFPAIVLGLDLALLWPAGWRRAEGPSLRGALLPFAAVVLLLAVTQYPWNRLSSSGEFLLDPLVPYDTAFHVGLARELTLGYPPQLPGVSGFPVGYHLGADLVRAAALRWARIDPYDSISRLDVTLGAAALVLALCAFGRRAGLSRTAVSILPWTLLATDLAFIFVPDPWLTWWPDLLRGNILISLSLANPVVPALAMVLAALVALSRYDAGEGRGWLALAAALAFAVPFFKVFLGAHLVLGLAVAALLAPAGRRAATLAPAVPCALATALLALGTGGRTVEVALAPLDLVCITRESLGLAPLGGAGLLGWAALWVLASLGLRLLALPAAVRALRAGPPPLAAAAAMALAAWPLGLLFRVSAPEMLPGQRFVNDAAYVIEQGGPLLWIFTVPALVSLAAAYRPWAVGALCAALSLPGTAQFVVRKVMEPPDPLPAPMVRAMADLEHASRPGDVVLQRPGARYPPAPVILIGRRVPYERFTPYLTQFASRDALERRHETVFRFFRTADATEARQIAQGLDARFVCLYGPDRLRFDTAAVLAPVHVEAEARCFLIVPDLASGAAP
jgi:hypothetical protein